MINNLKIMLEESEAEENGTLVFDINDIQSRNDIRDAFLDDVTISSIGAETDPDINKLIAKIPEDEEGSNNVTPKEINKLTESFDDVDDDDENDDVDGVDYDEDDIDDDDSAEYVDDGDEDDDSDEAIYNFM